MAVYLASRKPVCVLVQAAQEAGKSILQKAAGPSAASPAQPGQAVAKGPGAVKKRDGATYPPMPTMAQQQVRPDTSAIQIQ